VIAVIIVCAAANKSGCRLLGGLAGNPNPANQRVKYMTQKAWLLHPDPID
jgi:hypothetical protein